MDSSECVKVKANSNKLHNIDENGGPTPPADWFPSSVQPPETPTESMEFLARAWSLSATELSKALSNTNPLSACNILDQSLAAASLSNRADEEALDHTAPKSKHQQAKPPPSEDISLNSSSTGDEEAASKELFTLNQVLHPDLLYTQQILKNGIYKPILKGKATTTTTATGRWSSKDQKEKKKHEIRTHNAQLHAAVSVAGVAAAIAAITASTATENTAVVSTDLPPRQVRKAARASRHQAYPMMTTAIASAAALVASHCIEIAEEMGADHRQILTTVGSAVNARSNGDIMALTAGAATALRGVATLKARLRNGYGGCQGAIANTADRDGKDLSITAALNFISAGGELLKRTRKGDLHWKQVSFRMSSTFQVVIKLKSKHVAGTYTKKKKFLVSELYTDVPAWQGREWEEYNNQAAAAYFAVRTTGDRVIEFECKNKVEKKMWTDGIQHMLNHCMSDMM